MNILRFYVLFSIPYSHMQSINVKSNDDCYTNPVYSVIDVNLNGLTLLDYIVISLCVAERVIFRLFLLAIYKTMFTIPLMPISEVSVYKMVFIIIYYSILYRKINYFILFIQPPKICILFVKTFNS